MQSVARSAEASSQPPPAQSEAQALSRCSAARAPPRETRDEKNADPEEADLSPTVHGRTSPGEVTQEVAADHCHRSRRCVVKRRRLQREPRLQRTPVGTANAAVDTSLCPVRGWASGGVSSAVERDRSPRDTSEPRRHRGPSERRPPGHQLLSCWGEPLARGRRPKPSQALHRVCRRPGARQAHHAAQDTLGAR